MPLSPGTHLGPYEILAPIGAGGMGEVYRARDTKLDRDVAIKVLPAALAQDPERLARFEREAKVLAALNHPNIAQIYGLEQRALVMELVEGETLKGPLPLETALNYAKQIADALEAAHEKGITHRDLKPANIMITPAGVVKVLDFGLAVVTQPSIAHEGDPNISPTLTMRATQMGMILGTAAYMSPEQARGKTVDKRADIWAFGVVLHEMLTGHPPFTGDDITEILASVVKTEPDLSRVPAELRTLLQRCLEKDPKKRLRDIGDVDLLLAGAPRAAAAKRPWLNWAAAAWFAASTAALAFVHFREKPPAPPDSVRFQIFAPPNSTFGDYLALSPDGRQLAFTAIGSDGRRQLWVRSLDAVEPRLLPVTQGASTRFSYTPFWSPDSRFIAFGDGGQLKKVDVSGGPAQTICEVKGSTVGLGSWSRDGVIVFATTGSSPGMWRVSAAGGNASLVTMVDPSRQEFAHTFPFFLPDGKHFLYVRRTLSNAEGTGVYVGSLDLEPKQQPLKRLLTTPFSVAYGPYPGSGPGHLLFLRDTTLMSQALDTSRLELTGEAVPVAEQIGIAGLYGFFTASTNGHLAYRGGGGGIRQLTWFDRQGKIIGTAGAPHSYGELNLSPDGNRVAVFRSDNGSDLWTIELARGTSTRFTFDPANESYPVWSPDGSRVIFSSSRNGSFDLFQKSASGAGEEELLFKSGENKVPLDWSRDGRFLLYDVGAKSTGSDLWVLPLEGERKPALFLATPFNEGQGRFSPDGRWVAYTSDESGSTEVYVRPFPASSAGKWQVSTAGGQFPRWRRDGKELFYLGPDNRLMSADVNTNPSFKAGIPKPVFAAPIPLASSAFPQGWYWDVTPDGQRFLANTTLGATNSVPITVVTNWQSALKK